MDQYPYLIAIALIEQNGERSMPIGGKSITTTLEKGEIPTKEAQKIALELSLRVLQKSESGPLKRSAGDKSFLLINIPMEIMQEKLPKVKSEWIHSGNNENLIRDLKKLSIDVWNINFIRYEGVKYTKLN